jgi:hypothetical protein
MRELPMILAFVQASVVAAAAQEKSATAPGPVVRASVAFEIPVSDYRLDHLDSAPGMELFVACQDGSIETVHFAPGFPAEPVRSRTRLQDSDHCALALMPIAGQGIADLFVASPRGVERLRPDAHGAFSTPPKVIAPRARMRLRTGKPVFAPLATDVNGDGLTDLVVPNGPALEVWIQQVVTGEVAEPPFAKVATVQVRVSANVTSDASLLSDDLEASLLIPSLRMADVNGDKRPDLLVEDGEKRAFHLVRPDGSIPSTPDVSVDLGIFRDTTPEAEITLGRTLAGSNKAVYESRDLDLDGIPDYVIAHRRKVWVFFGTKDGPQFTEPATVLKAADDVTGVQILNLDDDGRPDLLLVRVQVPSLATLLRGLVSDWEVEADAVGYRNSGERKFETTPKWRSTISFTVPSILGIAKDPDKLIRRFEDVGKKFRSPAEGDFDGDGAGDLALVSEDGTTLDMWRGNPKVTRAVDETPDAIVRRLLFEDENKAWDIDRLLAWLGGFGERRIALLTGGRPAEAHLTLRDAKQWRLVSVAPADVDGDGRVEVVLRYDEVGGAHGSAFDVIGWK